MNLATPSDIDASAQVRKGAIELRLIGDDGTEQPWDGKAMGEVQIRGPWVATEYYKDERPGEQWHDGWLKTGARPVRGLQAADGLNPMKGVRDGAIRKGQR